MVRRVVFFTIGVLLAVSPARAQQGVSELRGRVIDEQGSVLPGVPVVARIFNVTNHTNFGTPASDLRSPSTFLVRRTTISPIRTAQLNFRYAF